MTQVLLVTVTGVLAGLAVLHLLWAVGYWWPIRDEAALARAVLGTDGVTRMPGAVPCALVGTALAGLAVWLHLRPDHPMIFAGSLVAALIFLARGVAAYVPAFQRLTPEPAFRRNDTRYFGPLCLSLGAAVLMLALAR